MPTRTVVDQLDLVMQAEVLDLDADLQGNRLAAPSRSYERQRPLRPAQLRNRRSRLGRRMRHRGISNRSAGLYARHPKAGLNAPPSQRELSHRKAAMNDIQREYNEAIEAADAALAHLYRAQELLGSAGNWGLFDIFAGGAISSYIKRSKMQEAQTEIDAAREALRVFVKELHDVEGASGIQIDTGGFMSFADMFFDNAFLDMYVQMQISEARQQVAAAIQQVEAVREALNGRL